jgi:hypothetical protein
MMHGIARRACVRDRAGARSRYHRHPHRNVSLTRLILVALICASPAVLLWDGLITQGIVAGIIAVALAITAKALRPGETTFLVTIVRPWAVIAAIPAIWIVFQILPIGLFANPIWSSAAAALDRTLWGAVSVNLGASAIALGQYLALATIAFLTAAVALDRNRAESILFALTAAVTLIALILLAHDLFWSAVPLDLAARQQALDCAAIGIIIAGAAGVRTIERYETRRAGTHRSVPILERTFLMCSLAAAICIAAVLAAASRQELFATAYGVLAMAAVILVRRLELRMLGVIGIAVPALAIAFLLLAAYPTKHGTSIMLAFAAPSPPPLVALDQRVLDDAPLLGIGAGSFAAIAPIFRQMGDPPAGAEATTAAATLAIELGQPMFWLIVAAMAAAIGVLLRAALQRGRDSFYPAMGGSCLVTQLILAFINAGFLGFGAGLILAAALGLAFVQSRSRTGSG